MKLLKRAWLLSGFVMLVMPVFSGIAFASSLYTISGPTGGTEIDGYYTSPPSLTFVLSPSYPEPCVANGGTVPGNGTINVELSSNVGASLDGSYNWQVLEDSISHALLITDDGNWHDGHIIDACNWNGPNPNWQVVWSQTIKYDSSPPNVSITSPSNNSNEASSTIDVSGTVSDSASGVMSVSVSGVVATISGNSYSARVPLNMGLNALVATATDNVGHQAKSSQVTVFRYEDASSASSTNSNSGSGTPTSRGGTPTSSQPDINKQGATNSTTTAPTPKSTDTKAQPTDNFKLVKTVATGTGISLATILIIVIILLVLDRLGIIEIKLFHDYHEWRKKHYLKLKRGAKPSS